MQPILIFDGDCGFCTRSVTLAMKWRSNPEDFSIAAYQDLDLAAYSLTDAQCEQALRWVDADGTAHAGENAVARLLSASAFYVRPIGAALRLPLINPLAGLVYRWVAAHRQQLPGGTPACAMPPAQRPS